MLVTIAGSGFLPGATLTTPSSDGVCGQTNIVSSTEITAQCVFTNSEGDASVTIANSDGSSVVENLNPKVTFTAPSPPEDLSATQFGDNMVIKWSQPAVETTQTSVASFDCQIVSKSVVGVVVNFDGPCNSSDNPLTTSSSISFDDSAEQEWTISVSAVGTTGLTSNPDTVEISSSGTCPTQPIITLNAETRGTARFSVTSPSAAGTGGPIIGYQYSVSGGKWKSVSFSTNRQIVVAGLIKGKHYTISVRSSSPAGYSPQSTAVSFTSK